MVAGSDLHNFQNIFRIFSYFLVFFYYSIFLFLVCYGMRRIFCTLHAVLWTLSCVVWVKLSLGMVEVSEENGFHQIAKELFADARVDHFQNWLGSLTSKLCR